MTEETWKDVWERKGSAAAGKQRYTAAELFSTDGFDSALGKTSEASRAHISNIIRSRLGIAAGQRILEVGCGAGAVLSLLADSGAALSGADYSAPHIEIARRALPSADLRVAEACSLRSTRASSISAMRMESSTGLNTEACSAMSNTIRCRFC
jgi:cyclopropane fatty-acyl-phospholipid synthase-like methyltransferase